MLPPGTSSSTSDGSTEPDRSPTYIAGMDVVLGGGVPSGRCTLVAGGPGSGKTVMGMEFVARGAAEGEPGVFLSFEQTVAQLRRDFSTFATGVPDLVDDGAMLLRHIEVDAKTFEETGEYGLDALMIRIGSALDEVGAKRLAMDTLDTLFAHLRETHSLRAEIRRLFEWLHDRGVTAVVTAEAGDGTFTQYGLEAYVSDCVILLDQRVHDGLSTRRARVLKYRGAGHSDDEHPFLIDGAGMSLIPIVTTHLDHEAFDEQMSTGLADLDDLIEGGGYFRGSSVLVTGTAGTGKSSLAVSWVAAACARGERALYLAFEESQSQILRNMNSIGMDLSRWLEEGLLHVRARRPAQHGLEAHLLQIERLLDEIRPRAVAVDPFTNLISVGSEAATAAMLTRLVDMLKERDITGVYTSLIPEAGSVGAHGSSVSSVMDTWIALSSVYQKGERKRSLHILKSRGMQHSHGLHLFTMTPDGLEVGETLDERTTTGNLP